MAGIDDQAAATSRRFPTWVRWELRLVFVGMVTMNVWSPWGEPWWWRLMFLAVASLCVAGLWAERRTFAVAALCDLRDTVDQFLDGDASLQDLGAALDRAYKVPRV